MKLDIYQHVTDAIVAKLESGVVPWHRPWRIDIRDGAPQNVSGRHYRGFNIFILAMQGYEDPRWLTFNQARKSGGTVKKDERSTVITYWQFIKTTDKKDPTKIVTIPLVKYHTVFNVEQCSGLPEQWTSVPEEVEHEFDPILEAERMIADAENMPTITHRGSRAFYRPATDTITLPSRKKFEKAEGYYGTAFHEMIHATGHASRLNREEVQNPVFGKENYAREELVAEMGAAMLCATAGLDPEFEQNAAYISSWLRALKNDKKLVLSAGTRAQKAVDFIIGAEPENDEPAQVTVQPEATIRATPKPKTPKVTPVKEVSTPRAKYIAQCEAQKIPVVEVSPKVRRRLKTWENKFPGIRIPIPA